MLHPIRSCFAHPLGQLPAVLPLTLAVEAAEAAIGIFEMAPSAAAAECAEFMPIVEWVGRQRDPAASGDGKVIDLASRRWMERTPGLSTIGSRS